MQKVSQIKCLNGLMLLSSIGVCFIAFGEYIFILILKLTLFADLPKGEAAAVGIIGGADGPTAISLGSTSPSSGKGFWILLFLIIFVISFLRLRKVVKE